MNDQVKDITAAPLRFFEEISAIPRASLHEEQIADYLVKFARDRSLAYLRDAAHNVLIKKPASEGKEDAPTVLLQAHTDMVTEKHPHVVHDFMSEGLRLLREGNNLFADGTTLGADDGFGVAIMLAVLDDPTLSHPALECLFTSAEEIGLVGAGKYDYSTLTATYMVNLDSAEEDTVIVGCCGGLRSEMTLPIKTEHVDKTGVFISLGGLCGGHSGEDIHRGRLNANVLMGKLLSHLLEKTAFRIASITGGEKTNAIPRECEVLLLPDDLAAARVLLQDAEPFLRSHLTAAEDSGLFVRVEEAHVGAVMRYEDTARILRVLSMPNGVLRERSEPPIMPELSRNLARVRTEAGAVSFGLSSRSARGSSLYESRAAQDALAAEIGATVAYYGEYPGWESAMDAPLVHAWQKAFATVTGKHTEPTLIHAGLETGLITNSVQGLQAIAVGCNVHDLHTPRETMEIDSFLRIHQTLLTLLRDI